MLIPKVSVLVPTYNRSRFLKQTLESVFQQSLTDFEVIVVDNCSTDDTAAVVASFADARLVYVRNDSNIGAVNNYNKALRLARGQYIYLFSDDDVMTDPDNLQIKANVLDAYPTVGVVHSNYDVIDENGNFLNGNYVATQPVWREITASPLFKGSLAYPLIYAGLNFISMTSTLLRGSVLKAHKLEFNNQLRYVIDWNLWLQMALFCDFYYLDTMSTSHRRHTQNESSQVLVGTYYAEEILAKVGLVTLFGHTGKVPQTSISAIVDSIQNPASFKNTLARNVRRVQGRIRRMIG